MKTKVIKQSGKLEYLDKLKVTEYISKMPDGKQYSLEIKPVRKWNAGTDPQRKYYFGIIVPMWGEYCGYEKDEMHDILKSTFAPRERAGELTRIVGYSQMSTVQREDYHEKCRRAFFSTTGGSIPLPNEVPQSLYDELAQYN